MGWAVTGAGAGFAAAAYAGFAAASYFAVKFVRARHARKKIVGVDHNKAAKPRIPESCGIALAGTAWMYALLHNVVWGPAIDLFAWAALATGFGFSGFLDDVKNKFKGNEYGYWKRALPVVVLAALFAWMYAPAPAWVAGVLVPPPLMVLVVALLLMGSAAFHNTFAGLNGWEVGSAFIVSLGVVALLAGTPVFLPALAWNAMVLGLLVWNKFPARVFPGDSGTLLMGGASAALIVLAQDVKLMAAYALFFVPHAVDLFLKLWSNPGDISQASERPYALIEGKIGLPASGKLDFAKLIVKIAGPLEEWKVVAIIWGIQWAVVAAVLWLAG